MTEPRTYRVEDFQYAGIVCQAEVKHYTVNRRNSEWCLSKAVTKQGRYKMRGGWWDVYICENGHRFGVKGTGTGRVTVDVPTAKPVFGETAP